MEIWKDIEGYEELAQVNNKGLIKHLAKTWISGKGGINFHSDKFTVGTKNFYGYRVVTLRKNGKKKLFRIHILVAKAFIPNPENKPEVNHKDGNKSNNCIDNLEWVTKKENGRHAVETKLHKCIGEQNPASKLTNIQVKQIRELRPKYKLRELSEIFGVSSVAIGKICNNKSYNKINHDN